jgi:hypothetical protein
LRESGVDVILDKRDLKEGHDALAFMEQMVTNPEIKKVAIVCDEKYAAKAGGRNGGVGTDNAQRAGSTRLNIGLSILKCSSFDLI